MCSPRFAECSHLCLSRQLGRSRAIRLSLVAAVPGIGDAAAGVKFVNRGLKMAKTANVGVTKVAAQTLTKKEKRAFAKQFVNKDITKEELLSCKGITKENVDSVYMQIKIERKKTAYLFYETNGTNMKDTDSVKLLKSAKKNGYYSLYRYGLRKPVIIPESAYQLTVFKSGFENFRSENYNQPTGAWIW